MILRFGLEFDEKVFDSQKLNTQGGKLVLGVKGLLDVLEKYTGTLGPTTENNFLRMEQYRQAIKDTIRNADNPFYAAAFDADELATAGAILQMRDELLLAGLRFDKLDVDLPPRVFAIKEIEVKAQGKIIPGLADRFCKAASLISDVTFPFDEIIINEPRHLLPKFLVDIFDKFAKKDIQVNHASIDIEHKEDDLSNFRYRLTHPEDAKKGKIVLKADGSLVIIRAKRETEAGEFVSKLMHLNAKFKPLCLIPEKNRALDNAIIQEGVPSLGILSASLGRPSLQILKLVTAFLWEPIDPYKILEFLSLSLKPLDDRLAIVLGRMMAQSPGIKSEFWYANIARFFSELEQKATQDKSISVETVREQYNTWFERKRHNIDSSIPVQEAISVFKYIQIWGNTEYENLGSKNKSLLILKEQAKKIVELLEELPEIENKLSFLNLERIVRTVYEPAPVLFRETEINHLPFIYHNSAITQSVDELLWWNFTDHERDYFFSKWHPSELSFFEKMNWKINSPTHLNQLALWQRNTPIAKTKKRIIFIIPEKVSGKNIQAHSLEGDLKAAFRDLKTITYEVETEKGKSFLSQFFELPNSIGITQKEIGKTKAVLQINLSDKLNTREEETFTSLDNLFYYPYKWLFKYKIDLHKSSILSVVKEHTLKGNLAHRFFEKMLKENVLTWKRNDVEMWLDKESNPLLQREGAVLLMYGKEPDKVAFMRKVKNAAWSLVNMIQSNNWTIHETEMNLTGKFLGRPVKGKADLVLERDGELAVIDLKWGGKRRRLDMIKNREDLQLVMYSKLLTEDHNWAHTSYFIISNAEMLSRNNLGFKEATAASPEADHIAINEEIWSKMEKTYAWRMQQFKEGKIEVRTKTTLDELNEIYVNELMDILEMKEDNSPYDDYGTLVNLIE
jgi:ATP-dependent helicase/nuclease subunit B